VTGNGWMAQRADCRALNDTVFIKRMRDPGFAFPCRDAHLKDRGSVPSTPQQPEAANALNSLPLSGHSGHGRTCCWLDPVANDPGCVKTCTSQECAELFSLSSSLSSGRNHFWFSNLRNRDGISTRRLNVGVFTQPRPKGDICSRIARPFWLMV
jgi:hypothetical protein